MAVSLRATARVMEIRFNPVLHHLKKFFCTNMNVYINPRTHDDTPQANTSDQNISAENVTYRNLKSRSCQSNINSTIISLY
ncbi:hypothetical protein XCR1_1150002 [Xenorhabdus cabanillasii JM26]|uniref:Uncharacterized protein n=2 Tax=Xenorhabdus cabanillasii TaxID=351673 RepID=A0A3D9UFB8_9GAMM|nr:hypothetical protein Xcab_01473 [Xenorhabdus cabanillasii JM26]REF28162.1 hypothetical protein BDD26_3033 [Xenorhabdus cabanillasii]CDL79455.1 hypothetical protein XCR1_1150002 [Xenorhabdus cabanillasii JM26]